MLYFSMIKYESDKIERGAPNGYELRAVREFLEENKIISVGGYSEGEIEEIAMLFLANKGGFIEDAFKAYRDEAREHMAKGLTRGGNFPFSDKKFEKRFLGGRPLAISDKVPPEIARKVLEFNEKMNEIAGMKGEQYQFEKIRGMRAVSVGRAEDNKLMQARREVATAGAYGAQIFNTFESKKKNVNCAVDFLSTYKYVRDDSEPVYTALAVRHVDGNVKCPKRAELNLRTGRLTSHVFDNGEWLGKMRDNDAYELIEQELDRFGS
jgi:hypothetical protein